MCDEQNSSAGACISYIKENAFVILYCKFLSAVLALLNDFEKPLEARCSIQVAGMKGSLFTVSSRLE